MSINQRPHGGYPCPGQTCTRDGCPNRTWLRAFNRRLSDGTAYTTGWTEAEVNAEPDWDAIIAGATWNEEDGENGPYSLHRDSVGFVEIYELVGNKAVYRATHKPAEIIGTEPVDSLNRFGEAE
jgi:hypothetical protein